jgi:hypothetical protein
VTPFEVGPYARLLVTSKYTVSFGALGTWVYVPHVYRYGRRWV